MKNYLLYLVKLCSRYALIGVVAQCLFFTLVLADEGKAQSKSIEDVRVNIKLQDASFEDFINQVERQTNFTFFFGNVKINNAQKFTLNAANQKLSDVLRELSKKTGFSFKQVNYSIGVFKKNQSRQIAQEEFQTAAQEATVTGRVTTDIDSEGLPGVNVIIKGTNSGTVTDLNGDFSINVPSSASVLVFSSIGFVTEEVQVGDRTVINLVLKEDVTTLGEVVVIGYGTQRQEAVTGSVASVSGDLVREVPSSNITQALQGRVAGVEMAQTSSKPGSEMQIRIRGTRSLNAENDPLIVLDGIPFAGSIGDINPNDIKSVDILKDASATAIYGSRGANGVILVTTNRGQIGQKARVTYNAYYGPKKIFSKYPMMSGPEFVKLRQEAGMYSNALDEADNVNTDWQDLLYRTGTVTSHDIGISGGTQSGGYNFGVGYYLDKAVIPSQQYNRISLRGSIDQEVGKYFRFGLTTNNNYNATEGDQVGLYGILSMSPIANPYNEDGTWKRTVRMPLDEQWVYSRDILNGLSDTWLDETRGFGTYNNLYGEVKIPGIDGLKYRSNIGLNYRQSNHGFYTGEGINSSTENTPSTATIGNRQTINWVVENILSYDRIFAGKHELNVVGLYSAEQTRMNKSEISAKEIPADAFQFYNLGHAGGEITIDPENQLYEVYGLMSWMGRAMYTYNNRYMLTATVRSDGSSRLASGHEWHTYPAISAGWNIGNESFIESVNWVNQLKLRAGYGQTSNQAVDPYKTLGRLSTRPYNFGDGYSVGYYVSELLNPQLGWEYSDTWNYGVDFSILNNRLSGTIEYYTTHTKDILLEINLPPTAGVEKITSNIGETQNKGLELSLNGVILDNLNGWTWEAGVNLYANRNKLVKLASEQKRDEGNWWFIGHPIDVIYDYEKIGLWQEGESDLEILESGAGNPGMIKVKYTGEYNSDGKPTRAIGPEDRQILSLEPNFQGGFNTRVAFKGFDFSAVGAFKSGGMLISTLYSSSGYLNMMSGRRGNVKVDYWTPENTGAKFPKPGGLTDSDNPKYGSTLGYFDGSYLKVRTLSLGYNFENNSWIQNIGQLRVYATVQNPFVMFSPYHSESGMDPETNSYGDENAAVTTTYKERLLTIGTNTPSTRNYLIGINLTF